MVGTVKVTSKSGSGFKLDTCPNDWFNFSQFGPGAGLPMPAKESTVRVECRPGARGGYFVQSWQYLDDPNATLAPSDEQVAARVALHAGEIHDDKPVVTRLACLNAAIASFAGYSDEDVVLSRAEVFLAWAKGASIPDALAVINLSEPSDASPSDPSGSPEPEPSDSEPSSDTPAGSPTAEMASSSSQSRTLVSSKR